MNEPTKVYVATAYRWGWYNNCHYVVTAGVDRDAVIKAAEDECSDRGGKYGSNKTLSDQVNRQRIL